MNNITVELGAIQEASRFTNTQRNKETRFEEEIYVFASSRWGKAQGIKTPPQSKKSTSINYTRKEQSTLHKEYTLQTVMVAKTTSYYRE